MQKEIPILFSTAMVQALLKGRKTMTRRIVKGGINPNEYSHVKLLRNERADIGLQAFFFNKGDDACWGIKCPYGKVGDILWVRESWTRLFPTDENENIIKSAKILHYRSNWNDNIDDLCWADERGIVSTNEVRWKPSIHMPKDAARIWLEVTSIRVERAHDITEADAIAEGILWDEEGEGWKDYRPGYSHSVWRKEYPKNSFKTLWESINGSESWDANPWVWVVEFKVLSVLSTTGKPNNL